MRTSLLFAGILAVTYAVMCTALFLRQRSLIYYPQRASLSDHSVLRLPTPAGDVLVSQWLHDGPGALLYFGGNAEAVSNSLPTYVTAYSDHAVYGMHYRGYAGSAGEPSEQGFRQDALALYDRVARTHRDIIVVGRSLGSGVAVWLASQRPASRLILVTPFDSLQEIAAGQFPYFPVKWLLLDKYESWRYAPAVRAPTLILEAERDEIIPSRSTRSLAARFSRGIVTLKVLSEAHHNTIADHPQFVQMLRAWRQ